MGELRDALEEAAKRRDSFDHSHAMNKQNEEEKKEMALSKIKAISAFQVQLQKNKFKIDKGALVKSAFHLTQLSEAVNEDEILIARRDTETPRDNVETLKQANNKTSTIEAAADAARQDVAAK